MSDSEERVISGLKVRVERGSCIGTVACRNVAPDVFELDDQQVITFVSEPAEIDRDRLFEACQVCPVEALLLFDEEGEQVFP